MKAFLLYTASGPVVILSSHESPADEVFLGKLRAKGVDKFLAFELPLERYGGHYQTVLNDLHETDDLRILDVNGQRVFQLFPLNALGVPHVHDPTGMKTKVYMD